MLSHPDAANYEDLFDLIQSRTGLTLDVHRRNDVTAVLVAMRASGDAAHPADLVAFLSAQPAIHPLWQRLIHTVTIGETYFFRNSPQFEALRRQVLPTLIEQRRKTGSKQLRLWSAGCATGEEPYSLAILLRELLPDIETWNISLLGTDINDAYLQEAREGIYRARSFRNETPAAVRNGWFTSTERGYQLDPTIRKMVVFRSLNLTADDFPSFESNTMHTDVVLCRNVTIYFDRETTRQLTSRFHQALNNDGWLVVGHSEPQADLYEGFKAENFENTVFYRKYSAILPQQETQITSPIVPAFTPLGKHPERRNLRPAPFPDKKKQTAEVTVAQDFWARAKVAADHEQWDEARAWLDKAKAQGQFEPQVHYLRALVELNVGNTEQAFRYLRRAVYCDPNFALAHYMLGDLYNYQGARKEAARHWQVALSAVEHNDSQQVLPYSDDLTVEMLVELLASRLSGL